MDLEAEKLKYFENKTQLVFLNLDGTLRESCNTLVKISEETRSLFEIEPFLEGIKDVLLDLPLNEEINFPCIGQELLGKKGYFDLVFKKVEEKGSQFLKWIIIDLTEYYNLIIPIQQERNELDIQGEYLQMREKAVTLEKKLLEFQNNELKRAKKFKEEFFAQISHEMRTPLNSITGITDLLLKRTEYNAAESTNHQYLKDLRNTSIHITAIVNDILDLSKIEAGKISLVSKVFRLGDIINSITNSFDYLSSKKQISLESNIGKDIPHLLVGDQQKLTQIVINVLGNAVKYTEQGSINLRVRLLEIVEDDLKLQFNITDTGIGMNKEEVERIFEPYSRTKDANNKMYEGTGLGMSIVQKLINVMGGEIHVTSTKNKGTEISFILPFKKEDVENELRFTEVRLTSDFKYSFIKKVLIAEDDPMASKIMNDSIEILGLEAKSLRTGEEILDELNIGYYDLIILDKQLPQMDGLEVAQQIRRGNYHQYSREIPILIITGEKLESIPDSLNGMLMKPFSINQLGSTIYRMDSDLVKSSLINPRYLLEVTDGNSGTIIELMDIFIRDMPSNIASMKEMSKNSQFKELKKALHKIISNVQYIGIAGLDHMMEELETDLDIQVDNIDFTTRLNEIEKLSNLGLKKLELQKARLLSKL